MKKQFFYAAMAVALMASCTSEDDLSVNPVNPAPADENVSIQLGLEAPTVNAEVGGRAVGSVGDTQASGLNKWNGERLYIAMIDRKDKTLAKGQDGANILYDNYVYYAPRADKETAKDSIRIYQNESVGGGNAKDTLSHVYYPVSGQYDFYGWHLDDATGATAGSKPSPSITATEKKVNNIKINGWQDIMGAKTKEFTQAHYGLSEQQYADLVGWEFSARTARSKVHPILKFEHQLARLKFFVKAGSDKTAEQKYENGAWVANTVPGQADLSTAMQVDSIKVLNVVNMIDMNLEGTKNGVPAVTSAASADADLVAFSLGSRNGEGIMTALDPTAPKYYAGDNTITNDADYTKHEKGTQVGESVMFFPHTDGEYNTTQTINLEIGLSQLVRVLENETTPNVYDEDEWESKSQIAKLSVHASSLINQTNNAVKAFEPGKSYNIYITVYGFERIEITAELTAWENGGDVNVDVEEGQSRHDVKVNFKLQDAAGSAISGATFTAPYTYKDNEGATQSGNATFAETTTAGTYEATVPSFAVLKYTIEKDGFEPARGYFNARNGQDVTITMKATTPAQGGEEAEPFEVTFNYTLVDMTPVEVSDEDITISSPANCTVSNGKVTVPAGTTEIIYSIAETELYDAISESHATVSAEYPSVHVTMTPKAQAPTKKSFTIDVTNKSDFSVDFSLVVKEAGEEGATVEPTETNGNVFKLEVEKSYVISISGKAAEGSEPKTATKEIEVTAEMEDENTITIAFPTEEGSGI